MAINNSKGSKGKKFGKTVIAILIIGVIIAISVISYKNASETLYGDFTIEKKGMAEILYSDIRKFDESEEYPKTPDEVLEIYNECYRLLYGDMINNEEIISEILHIQRKLCSDEFVQMNIYEEQLVNLKEDIKNLKEKEVCVIDVSSKPAIYDKKHDSCFIKVTVSTDAMLQDRTMMKFNFKYHFIMDENGLWKIQSVETMKESNEQKTEEQ